MSGLIDRLQEVLTGIGGLIGVIVGFFFILPMAFLGAVAGMCVQSFMEMYNHMR